jgi:hypothetical protein
VSAFIQRLLSFYNPQLGLQEIARQQRTTLSDLLRLAALGHLERTNRKWVPEVNRKIYFELGRISEKLQEIESSSNAWLALQKLLNEVRRELLGLES